MVFGAGGQKVPFSGTPAATAVGVFAFLTAVLLILSAAAPAPGTPDRQRMSDRNYLSERDHVPAQDRPPEQDPRDLTERWTRSLPLSPGGQLELTNLSGDITVRGTAGRQVRLRAIKRVALADTAVARVLLAAILIEVSPAPDRAEVQVRHPATAEVRRLIGREPDPALLGVAFDLEIPRDVALSVTTMTGHITVRGTGAEVRLETSSGDITVSDAAGVVEAGSIRGDIRIERAAGVRYVNAVSGRIDLTDVNGRIKATCVSGDIAIRGGAPSSVEANSTGGDILWQGAVPPRGSFQLASHSGTVEFIAEGGVGFSVTLSTVLGSIIAPLELTLAGENVSRRSVSGWWGEPDATLALTAFSGDIILITRP